MNVLPSPNNTIVYDLGSGSTKLGYAGDALPMFTVPPYMVARNVNDETEYHVGDSWIQKRIPGLEMLKLIEDNGAIAESNRDSFESFIDWTYSDSCLSYSPQDHPILVTQPTSLIKSKGQMEKWRKTMCEVFFNNQHPYLCLEYDASLAAYSFNVSTCLVVDFGWSCTKIVPIFEGRPIFPAVKPYMMGVSAFADYVDSVLKNQGKMIYTPIDPPPPPPQPPIIDPQTMNIIQPPQPPGPMASPPEYSELQIKLNRRNVVIDITKTHLSYLPAKASPDISTFYFMPGREPIDVRSIVNSCGQIFWQQSRNLPPLPSAIAEVIQACPGDVRRQLWGNVAICGGLGGTPGLSDTLQGALTKLAPKNYTVEVLTPMHRTVSGQFAVWTGGSIFGSVDNFPEFCISKQEWEEQGEAILDKKCQ